VSQRTEDPEQDAIAAAVTVERLALCELVEGLQPQDWDMPSLCEGWTVRHVVGHLALATQETFRDIVIGMIRARGNFDRMVKQTAIAQAQQFEPGVLIDQIRATASSTRRAPMSSPLDPLVDIIVHTQDIARPLELTYTPKPDHVTPALDHAVESRWYGGIKRFADVALQATDTAWTAGGGDQAAAGVAIDLLLMATGRAAGLGKLSGPGVAPLQRRLDLTQDDLGA